MTRAGSRCLFGLAPTGGYRAVPVTRHAVGSYPTFSPLPFGYKGGLFSVALFRRLSAPRRYLAVCPVELGLSSSGPFSRPPATIGPTTSRAQNYGLIRASGKALPHKPANHAPQTVVHRAVEPESGAFAEDHAAQPRRFPGRKRRAIGLQSHRGQSVDLALAVAPQ
jgi:hypothetical protein